MFKTAKTALVAAFVLGSATAAFAQASGEEFQNSPYQLNPNAPVPLYTQQQSQAYARALRPNLIEGRNAAIDRSAPVAAPTQVDRLESFGGY